MAKKGDDFNFDELDWPDFEMDEPAELKDDRNPVSAVAKQVSRGAKKIVFDSGRIRKTAKAVLPGSHSNVASAAFDAGDMLKDVYENVAGEAGKTKREVQKSIQRFNKQTKGMFGSTVEGALKKLGGAEEAYYSNNESDSERRRREVDESIADIFGSLDKEKIENKERGEAKALRQEVLNKRRFTSQMSILASMAGSMGTIAEHTNLDSRYKRKTMELQLQSNQLMGDMLEQLVNLRTSISDELKAITKNTALPEAAKIELTEDFKRVNQQRLMESLGSGIYGGLGDFLGRTGKGINKRFTNVVGGKLRAIRSGVGGGLDSAGEMLRMQQEMKENGGEDDTIETIIELLGGIAADRGINKWGGKAKAGLGKLSFFKGKMGLVDNIAVQGARSLNRQAGLRGTHDGMLGSGLDFLRALLDRTSLNDGLSGFVGGPTSDYDEVKMRKRSTLSTVTIIPGLLARIHHENVKMRTGDDSVPMIKFNPDTGVFTDSRTLTNSVRERLVSKGVAEQNTKEVDKIIDGVVDSSKMTGGQRKLLRDHIAHLNMRQLPFDPKAIAGGQMQIFGKGSDDDRKALRELLGKEYGVDHAGKITGDADKYHGRVAEAGGKIMGMKYNLNDPRKMVTDLIQEGRLEELISIGAVVERHGQMVIDFDKINEMRFDESAGQGSDVEGAFSPRGIRKNADVTQIVKNYNKTRVTSTVNNNQQSNQQNNLIRMTGGGGNRQWGGEERYNSEYQSLAMEEVIDVLQRGQTESSTQAQSLIQAIEKLVAKQGDGEEAYNSGYQTMVLEEIMDILQDGRQFTNVAGSEGGAPGMLGRARGRLGAGIKSLKGKFKGLKRPDIGGVLSNVKSLAMGRYAKNRDFVKGLVTSGKDRAKGAWSDVQDWYKTGDWKPALEARKLAAKSYIDESTGKVVNKLIDVRGNILEVMEDGSTRIAVTYEELREGLRSSSGKQFILKKGAQVKEFAGNMVNRALGRHAATKDAILRGLKGGYGATKSLLFGIPDVYVKGESLPRLLSVLAKNGQYITVGGGKVRTLNDITGPVADRVGNIVLSEEDIAKGLVDADGKDLEKFLPGLKGMINRITSLPGRASNKLKGALDAAKNVAKRGVRRVGGMFKGLGGMLKGFTGGIMSKLGGMFSGLSGGKSVEDEHLDVAYAQLEVQGMMLDQLVASNKNRKKGKGKWDSDGDGLFDGSWKDLLARRKAKKAEETSGEKDGKEKKPSKMMGWLKGAFGSVAGIIGSAISGVGGAIWDAVKWLGGIIAGSKAAGALGDIMDRGGRGGRRGRGRPGGRPGAPRVGGRFGRIGNVLGRVATGASSMLGFGGGGAATSAAGGAAVRTAGSAAAGAAGRGLLMRGAIGLGGLALGAGRLALGLNPWTLAATAAYYGGKALYNWWDGKKPRPLQATRLAQYGVDREDGDAPERYLKFEEWVLENTKQSPQGGVVLSGVEQEDILEAMEDNIGNVEDNPERAMNWFSYRFMPVFNSWSYASNAIGRAGKLAELDDVLTPVQAGSVFDKAKNAPASTRGIPLPNPDDKTLSSEAVAQVVSERGKEIASKNLGVKEGDNSKSGIAKAVLASTAASATGAEAVVGGRTGQMLGFAAEALPGLKGGIMGFNALTAGFKQFMSTGDGLGGYSELKLEKGPVDALRSVRMKVYGLSELSLSMVNALIRLECSMASGVKYSGKDTAIFGGDSAGVIENALASFGINTKDTAARSNFANWFERRFVPAYLAYMGAAHKAGLSDPLRAHLGGSLSQQYYAGNAMVAASTLVKGEVISVWRTGLHPVYGANVNSNPSTIVGNMETLLAGAKESELSEISGEKGGIISKAEKLMDRVTGKVTEIKNSFIKSATSWMPEGVGSGIRKFFGADGPSIPSGGETPNTPTSTMNQPGGSYTPQMGAGATINFDENGGKNGNVMDIPLPTGPKGFEEHMGLIMAVAKMTGVDPGVLAGLFATESSFDSRAVPGTSSAKGLGQFIDTTWDSMVKQYGHLFGIKPGTSANDPRANALMTVMYMKENAARIKKDQGKTNVTDVDLYLAHFLGAGGYNLLAKNPNASAAQLLPAAARANKSIFYHNGDTSRPRTGAEVMAMQANKQIKNRNHYGPLMHAYVKEKGGTVDSSIFNADGAAMNDIGKAQPAKAANDPVAEAPATTPAPGAPKTGAALLMVDAGGMPQAPASVTPAASIRNAGIVGSDVTTPPTAPTGDMGGMVKVANQASQTAEQTHAQNQQSSMTSSDTGEKLIVIGKSQLDVLRLINAGIESLVKQATAPAAMKATPGNINGLPNGPMSVKQASSV